LKAFKYLEAKTVEDACGLLKKYGKDCKVIAGGTDLLVRIKDKILSPSYLMNIHNIPDLCNIKYDSSTGITIGPLVSHSEIIHSDVIQHYCPLLIQSCKSIGGVQVRNLGTIGGNICNASPASDASIALLALEATLEVTGSEGKRTIPIENFFVGPGVTALRNDEILTEIRIRKQEDTFRGIFLKLGIKKAMQIGIVTIAVGVNISPPSPKIKEVRIALGSVAPTPVRALKAEDTLKGNSLNEKIIKMASKDAILNISPITDVRGTAEYRREMVEVLVRRAMNQIGSYGNKEGGFAS
jgi:CO/xanthine dehydrogenase FAD-binding subunit